MRVIAGVAGGQLLKAPRGRRVRPTSDRVKEALFDILGDKVKGARVLDLYAGSGSLAIEALSRGAEEAYLVDASKEAIRAIKANLNKTGLSNRAHIIEGGVEAVLSPLSKKQIYFDLIFIDPPYTIGLIELEHVFNKLHKGNLLSLYSQIVLESSSRVELPRFSGFETMLYRKYGDTILSFYKLREGT